MNRHFTVSVRESELYLTESAQCVQAAKVTQLPYYAIHHNNPRALYNALSNECHDSYYRYYYVIRMSKGSK